MQVAWFYCFFPALLGYFLMMAGHLNAMPVVGHMDVVVPGAFHKVIPKTARMEVVSDGHTWTEGPVWVEDGAAGVGYLLFSDTVENTIYKVHCLYVRLNSPVSAWHSPSSGTNMPCVFGPSRATRFPNTPRTILPPHPRLSPNNQNLHSGRVAKACSP